MGVRLVYGKACKRQSPRLIGRGFTGGVTALPVSISTNTTGSAAFKPFALPLLISESVVSNCDALAQILITPDDSSEGTDNGYFTGNAQMLVSGITMHLVENCPDEATLPPHGHFQI